MRGDATAQEFHTQVVSLGLAALLPDLAALCPDAAKRTDLLEVHRTMFVKQGKAKVRAVVWELSQAWQHPYV